MEMPLLFYWPSTLMMVDDDSTFMETVSFQLKDKRLRVVYNDPKRALTALKANAYLVEKIYQLAEPFVVGELDEKAAAKKLDYQSLIGLIYEKNRFSIISTVLIDCFMQKMNALDFCRAIKNLPVKKIMLAKAAGYDMAISAFNEGLIDGFIEKNENHLVKNLNEVVVKMKQAYFYDIALGLIGKTEVEPKLNADYLTIFSEFLVDHNIEEYYQLDHYGSYLGLDKTGYPYWFMVRTEDNFNEALDVVRYNNGHVQLIQQLRRRSHLLFLLSEVEKKFTVANWDKFLFPIKKSFHVNGRLYYCAVVGGEKFSLVKQEIMDLEGYLKSK